MYDQDITLEQPAAGHYLDLSAYVSVPMLLGSGYHIRRLTPSVEYTFNNGYTIHKDKYVRGVHRITASLQFSDYVRQATRNILPRWGYLLRGALCTEPSNSDFKTLLSIYAAGYLPAIAANHSIMLRANYQMAVGEGKYTFRRKELFPRGALYDFSPEEYAAASLDYQLPLCYPDWGIPSVIFLKRIRLNLWADYAYCKLRYPNGLNRYDLYSYGADVILDICPFRLPSQATTSLKITLAAPSDRGGVRVLMGVELPL